jgi:hypothetical protein
VTSKTHARSRRSVTAAVFLVACHLSPVASPAASWEDEKQIWESLSNAKDYKDPGYAAKLSLNFLPVDNGHFYVGDVGKGIWFSVGETTSLAAVAVPLLNSQSRSKEGLRPIWTDAMVATAALGGVSYIALKVWSAYDAAASARRFNAARKAEKQGFRWRWAPDGAVLTRAWGGATAE